MRQPKFAALALALVAATVPVESALALGLPVMQRGLFQGSHAAEQFAARMRASLGQKADGTAPIAGGTCGYTPRQVYDSVRQYHPELNLAENPTAADLVTFVTWFATLEARALGTAETLHDSRMVQNGGSCSLDLTWQRMFAGTEVLLFDRNTGEPIASVNCGNIVGRIRHCFLIHMDYRRTPGVAHVEHGARVVVHTSLTPEQLQAMLADRCTAVVDQTGEHAPAAVNCSETCPNGGVYPPADLAHAVGLPGRPSPSAFMFVVASGHGDLRVSEETVRLLHRSVWCVDSNDYQVTVRVTGSSVDYTQNSARSYWDDVHGEALVADLPAGAYHTTLTGASSFRVAAN